MGSVNRILYMNKNYYSLRKDHLITRISISIVDHYGDKVNSNCIGLLVVSKVLTLQNLCLKIKQA